jgi:hypothetical protein
MRVGIVIIVLLVATGCASTPLPPGAKVNRTLPPIISVGPLSTPLPAETSAVPAFPEPASIPAIPFYPTAGYRCDQADFSWAECPSIEPVGSLKRSVSRRSGAVTVIWSSNCGCYGNFATGQGEARWCKPGADCRDLEAAGTREALLGIVVGGMDNGQFTSPVKINTAKGRYGGSITREGDYDYGVLWSSHSKFVGRFNPDGTLASGALHANDQVVLANRFVENRPDGVVMVGYPDGRYVIQECSPAGCKPVDAGQLEAMGNVYSALYEVALDRAGNKVRDALFQWLPELRRAPVAFAVDVIVTSQETENIQHGHSIQGNPESSAREGRPEHCSDPGIALPGTGSRPSLAGTTTSRFLSNLPQVFRTCGRFS